jgi:hypothetical protein
MRETRTAQEQRWIDVLKLSWRHDFYHLPRYHSLAEQAGEGTAHLFVHEEGGQMIALPLLLRSLDKIPALADEARGWSDATSVYGYPGPISSQPEMPRRVIENFQDALRDTLAKLGVVAVFSRLHPLIPQPELLAGVGECIPLGQTVSIDLTLTPKAQRAQYRHGHDYDLRKIERLGIVCIEDSALTYLDQFVAIYAETMRRVNADGSYLFDREYFEELLSDLGCEGRLFIALKDGQAISGSVFIGCDGILQYHLSGTRDDFVRLAPSKLVIETARQWACEHGFTVFHLGGGVGTQVDSLFRFKAGFSNRRHEFRVWQWILAPEVYAALCAKRERWNSANGAEPPISREFFPAYRCATRPLRELARLTNGATSAAEEEVGTNG